MFEISTKADERKNRHHDHDQTNQVNNRIHLIAPMRVYVDNATALAMEGCSS
jgi:hypothetical protein